jgi:TPR repeat protein
VLGGVFICYRREDSAGFARLIYDRLTHKLGHDSVFFDVDNIAPGLDFVDILSDRVGRCDALIAVIGKSWVSSAYLDDKRRLDDPNDFVRIEIEAALARKIRVIPILVDGAAMPRPDDLPDSLKKLTRRQGIEISHSRFDSDVDRLTRALSLLEEELRQREAMEQARLAEADVAWRAEEKRRAEEAAEAERIAREQREQQQFAESARAEEIRRKEEFVEAAQRAQEERRAQEAAKAVRAKVEEQEPAEVAKSADSALRVREEKRRVAVVVNEPSPGAASLSALAEPARASGKNKLIVIAAGVSAVILLGAIFLSQTAQRGGIPPIAESTETASGEPIPRQGQKSTDQGDAEAKAANAPNTSAGQYELGERYYYGRGVQQDYAKAMEWYRKAADQGDRAAQIMLGSLYENALGVSKDDNEARSWYRKAADQGSPLAEDALERLRASDSAAILIPSPAPSASMTPQEQYEKGDAYYWGRAGVNQDYQNAFYWYQKAADAGDAAAQIMLGSLYENGLGVSKDYGRARSWYEKAADQGRPLAQDALTRLAGK